MELQLFAAGEDIAGGTAGGQQPDAGEASGGTEGIPSEAISEADAPSEAADASLEQGDAELAVNPLAERVIRAEAKAILARMGIPAASAQYVLKLMDAKKAIGVNGEPDERAVTEQVLKVLTDVPALRGSAPRAFNPPPRYMFDPFEEGFDRG